MRSVLQSTTTSPRKVMCFSTDWLGGDTATEFGLLMQTIQCVYDDKESSNALLPAKARAFVRQSSTGDYRQWTEGDDADDSE
jgi:hypothetical protein